MLYNSGLRKILLQLVSLSIIRLQLQLEKRLLKRYILETIQSPNYSDLKIYGYSTFVYVDNEKLKLRIRKCLGYKFGMKRYKLWCTKIYKMVISRDVVFHELAMF